MDSQTIAFLIYYSVDLFMTLLFILGFLHRAYLLNKMASQKNRAYQSSFWIKIGLLGCFGATDIAELLLSQFDEGYWLYDSKYLGLITIVPIFAIMVQAYVINIEHKKKERPVLWHRIFWIYEILVIIG
jgi:hypothetical protein